MKILLIVPIVLMLTGCPGGLPTKPDVVYVDKIITKECPEPAKLEVPEMYIHKLTDADKQDPGKVVQYWKATVKQLMGEVQSRDAVIDGYRKTSNETK
jgi:hypothetical protein